MKNILAFLLVILTAAISCFGQNDYPWDLRQKYADIPIKINNKKSWSAKEFSSAELRFIEDTLPQFLTADSLGGVREKHFPIAGHSKDTAEEIIIFPTDAARLYFYVACYYNGRFASVILYDQHKGDSIVGKFQTIEDWPFVCIKELLDVRSWYVAKIFQIQTASTRKFFSGVPAIASVALQKAKPENSFSIAAEPKKIARVKKKEIKKKIALSWTISSYLDPTTKYVRTKRNLDIMGVRK